MRVTTKMLDHKAESLTAVMRRAGLIGPDTKVRRDSAYGGHRFVITGGPVLTNGSISAGYAGLETAYQSTGDTFRNAHAIVETLIEVNYASRPPRF